MRLQPGPVDRLLNTPDHLNAAAFLRLIAAQCSVPDRWQAGALRARAAAGNVAITASKRAAEQEAELQALVADIDGRLGVRLGMMLVARGIKVGEVRACACLRLPCGETRLEHSELAPTAPLSCAC